MSVECLVIWTKNAATRPETVREDACVQKRDARRMHLDHDTRPSSGPPNRLAASTISPPIVAFLASLCAPLTRQASKLSAMLFCPSWLQSEPRVPPTNLDSSLAKSITGARRPSGFHDIFLRDPGHLLYHSSALAVRQGLFRRSFLLVSRETHIVKKTLSPPAKLQNFTAFIRNMV